MHCWTGHEAHDQMPAPTLLIPATYWWCVDCDTFAEVDDTERCGLCVAVDELVVDHLCAAAAHCEDAVHHALALGDANLHGHVEAERYHLDTVALLSEWTKARRAGEGGRR